MSKIKNLSRKAKVGVLASGAALAASLASAPVAGAAPAAPTPNSSQVQGTTVDTPVPDHPGAVLGHSKPDSMTTTHQDGQTRTTYYWRWELKALHPLVLPAVHGPPETPYLATTGEKRRWNVDGRTTGDKYVADMRVEASDGVGYGSFNVGSKTNGSDDHTYVGNGWPEGDLVSNNVWAGFSDGEFKLWATFTSDSGDYAHSARDVLDPKTIVWGPYPGLFPWYHNWEV
jgi:hypothetical protein